MCLQAYASCSCGHTLLYEVPCALAGAHPFYLKVACPNYKINRYNFSRPCGTGRFYCKEDQVGRFFEEVYNTYLDTFAREKQILSQIGSVNAHAIELKNFAEAQATIASAKYLNRAYGVISNQLKEYEEEKTNVLTERKVVQAVLKEGVKYSQARAAQIGKGFARNSHPFVLIPSLRYKLPERLQAQLAQLSGPGIDLKCASTTEVIDVSNYRQAYGDLAHPLKPKPDNKHYTPQQLALLAQELRDMPNTNRYVGPIDDRNSLNIQKSARRVKRTIEQTPADHAHDASLKKNQAAKNTSLTEESSFVRRSARTRDKKVNYAESEASTVYSRENSPYKSDADNISPPKSDISTASSPRQRMLRHRPKMENLKMKKTNASTGSLIRGSSSMDALLDEWRRGTDIRHAASYTQPALRENLLPKLNDGSQVNTRPPTNTLTSAVGNGLSALQDASVREHATSWNQSFTNVQHSGMPSSIPTNTRTLADWNINYMPSTPGPVPVPSYQHNMVTVMQNYAPIRFQQGTFAPPPVQPVPLDAIAQSPLGGSINFAANPVTPHNQSNGACRRGQINTPSPMNFNYDQLRRSFSATQELTPPVNVDAKSVDTDPKKRSLSASSPLPFSKRMRLSLPGDDAPNVYGQQLPYNNSMSSPPKMASRRLPASGENDTSTVDAGYVTPTPAPILAPTALMYVPKQQAVAEDPAAKLTVTDLDDKPGRNERVADDADNPSSDIDWGILNDEFF